MADLDDTNSEAGATVELALSELHGRLPATPESFRDHLSGLEPERQITDWGRSERIEGLVDRTVYDFLYHYWFRVEVEGIENIPVEGGALLVANHSAGVLSDSAMIAKALREEHPRRPALHLATEQHYAAVPGIGMLARKLGAVADHPANLHRLLFDERQLVLTFPEGRSGTRKPIKERYRLRGFGSSAFVESAARAGVPIVPLAVLGAEEASPAIPGLSLPTSLRLTPRVPFPSKFKIRFLEPIEPDVLGPASGRDRARARALAEEIRALIQENLLELVAVRRSVWLG
jgi:1-acyl-sn-glycerol-3-phosphate acyltransferase